MDPLCILVVGLALLVGALVLAGHRREDDEPAEPLSIFPDAETPAAERFNADADEALAVADVLRNGCGCMGCTQAATAFASLDALERDRELRRRPQASRLATRLHTARLGRGDDRDGVS